MNKRLVTRDQRAQAKAVARKTELSTQAAPEQRYRLPLAEQEKQVDACDSSPNLTSEFVLVRRIVQYLLNEQADPRLIAPWLTIESSLATSILSTGIQLRDLTAASSLRDFAVVLRDEVARALDMYAPDVKDDAIEALGGRLGETLLRDEESRSNLVHLPEAKQQYEFPVESASPNLSLSGNLKVLRFLLQGAIDEQDWQFAAAIVKKIQQSAATQILLARSEGILLSGEVSRRITHELIAQASNIIREYAPTQFEPVIDTVKDVIFGRFAQQEYQIGQQ